jgi:hypothetical protein
MRKGASERGHQDDPSSDKTPLLPGIKALITSKPHLKRFPFDHGVPLFPEDHIQKQRLIVPPYLRQKFEVTDEDVLGILNAMGEPVRYQPSNSELSTNLISRSTNISCLGKEEDDINRCRAWIFHILERLTMIAITCESTDEACLVGIDPVWWQSRVVNASYTHRERIHRIITDFRAMPPHLQFVLGQKQWNIDMFLSLPRVDHTEPALASENFVQYFIVVVRNHLDSQLLSWYSGSATATTPSGSGSIGWRSRLAGHERKIECCSAGEERVYLKVHREAAEPNRRRFYIEGLTLPLIDDPRLQEIEKFLVLSMEDVATIYTWSLNRNPDLNRASRPLLKAQSKEIVKLARPWDMPAPPFEQGLNQVLPSAQQLRTWSWHLKSNLELCAGLKEYWHKFKFRHLPSSPDELRQLVPMPELPWKVIKGAYKAFLNDRGVLYESSRTNFFRPHLAVLGAYVQFSVGQNPPLSVYEDRLGRYTVPHPINLDFDHIQAIALSEAGQRYRDTITKGFCRTVFGLLATSPTISEVFEKDIWEVLQSMHLLLCYEIYLRVCRWSSRVGHCDENEKHRHIPVADLF